MEVHHTWLDDEGGCYDQPGNWGNLHQPKMLWMPGLLVDRAEVTNGAYREFLRATGYRPLVLRRFLDHWSRPAGAESNPDQWSPPTGKDDHPVVWVDLDDARAYAVWAGKRLPTEEDWQYAAQGTDGRTWPWGDEFDAAKCNGDSADTTSVERYAGGASPFGCLDMAGNVWEWTESERNDGHTRYAILKSGSHFVVKGSRWYVAVGAQPCTAHQKMLLLYPGLDRCATIGFRCVKDL
jgi:formylglycine-generating enzyme required for sulfatase activity